MVCARCGKNTTLAVFHDHKPHCQMCHMHRKPFVMQLSGLRSHSHLYNITLACPERVMTVKQFENCGWFLRKKVEKGTTVYYTLEYHGKFKCSRCVDYHFPMNMNECSLSKMCAYRVNRLGTGQIA